VLSILSEKLAYLRVKVLEIEKKSTYPFVIDSVYTLCILES